MGDYEHASDPLLGDFEVPSLAIEPAHAIRILNILESHSHDESFEVGQSVHFWASAARFSLDLLVDQRFIPTLLQVDSKHLTATWTPWLHDEEVVTRFGLLLTSNATCCKSNDIRWPSSS